MSFFSGRSEKQFHDTRQRADDAFSLLSLNGHPFRVIVVEDERIWKVRIDSKGLATLKVQAGDKMTVGVGGEVWTVRRIVPTDGGAAWVWMEGR